MAKASSKYVCQQCGYQQVSWAGKCPNCGEWNSMVETITAATSSTSKSSRAVNNIAQAGSPAPILLSSIPTKNTSRISTKISELDRVLGGGLVSGQVVLIAGEPGIGKSTLLLQVAKELSGIDSKSLVLYSSGEESATQIKIRADRMQIKSKSISILEDTNIDSVISSADSERPTALIVDSIQTMYTEDLSGLSGSVGQVRESAYRLVKFAKSTGTIVFIVGHVTKQGSVAGPAVLAHIVDTVLWFEGEQSLALRILRSVKNRFGPTDEVGIFSMQEKGLISETDPERLFLTDGKVHASGSVISSVLQGTRPILVEIQSLVIPSKQPFPKRNAQGIDPRRFEMLLAVLIRRANLPLFDNDVLVNVAGGIKAYDPAVDLAVCLSVASAFYDKELPRKLIAVGEVGLLGEIRQVNLEDKRLKDAKRLGFNQIASSKSFRFLSQALREFLK